MLIIIFNFFCMMTNATNRHPSYRWFLGKGSQRNPEKVNSLIYKDYTLVEYVDGSKSYVSPEEKAQLHLEGKLRSSKVSLRNEKLRHSAKDSDSDSCYEVPVERVKPKSCEELDKTPRIEMKRNSSLPFFEGEMSPGDNGRINLPPYLVPLETSLTLPMTRQKRKDKKSKKRKGTDVDESEKSQESSSPDEVDPASRRSFEGPPRLRSDADESPEDAEVREITGNNPPKRFSVPRSHDNSEGETWGFKKPSWEEAAEESESKEKESEEGVKLGDVPEIVPLADPVELFPNESAGKSRYSRGFSFPMFPGEALKSRDRNRRKVDPNPLKKMFGIRGKKDEGERGLPPRSEDAAFPSAGPERYEDAGLSQIPSDTESADHGSADKSSVTKLTSEKQPKKLMSGLLGSFRKGKIKDKVADSDPARNPSSFEITVKEQPEDVGLGDSTRAEGIVYAELDMARSPGSVMRREDEKTEYAEIIYPGTKSTMERATEELRKSRENLSSSRENLTEVDEAFSVEGKKEAAV